VMADAVRRFSPLARERSSILDSLGLQPRAYALATVHREANVRPERLQRIVAGLGGSSRPVVFAAHPRTRTVLEANAIELPAAILLIDALGYLDFAALASQAAVIATDSGGLQKEAYWYGVPCVTMRPSTEWVDTVHAGANVLVDDDPTLIAAAIETAEMPLVRPSLYGDGHASERIATVLGGTIARCAS
jgi:UDP-GlcNAc3NAcA epimerase